MKQNSIKNEKHFKRSCTITYLSISPVFILRIYYHFSILNGTRRKLFPYYVAFFRSNKMKQNYEKNPFPVRQTKQLESETISVSLQFFIFVT
jgi:hypothetical protein